MGRQEVVRLFVSYILKLFGLLKTGNELKKEKKIFKKEKI